MAAGERLQLQTLISVEPESWRGCVGHSVGSNESIYSCKAPPGSTEGVGWTEVGWKKGELVPVEAVETLV